MQIKMTLTFACGILAALSSLVLGADERASAWDAKMDAGMAAQSAGNYDAAMHHFEQALALARADPPAMTAAASSLNGMGACLVLLGRFDEAIAVLEEAHAIFSRELGPLHPDSIVPLNNLANVHTQLGQHDRALEQITRALEIERKQYGEGSLKVAATRIRLGNALMRSQRLTAAEPEYLAAIKLLESAEGPEAVQHLRGALAGLGNLYREMGRLDEARAVLERSEKMRPVEGPDAGLEAVATRLNLGGAKLASGETAAALEILNQALVELLRLVPGGHPMVGSTHVNIGIAEAGLGRLDRAAEYLSRGCKILDDALPEGHADHLRCMRSHARVLSALGRKAEAAALQQRMASSAP